MDKIKLTGIAPNNEQLKRLDILVANLFPDYSRSKIQQWIKSGHLSVDGKVETKNRKFLLGGEQLELIVELEPAGTWQAQEIKLNVIDEDEDIIIINKQAGLVVHPGTGNPDKTLVNGLLNRFPELESLPRAGIIHRLDKETSGLLVVARNLKSHHFLTDQLQQRAFSRTYIAVVCGQLIVGGTITAPIGRHPKQRIKMAVVKNGKEAITHYQLIKRYRGHSLLQVKLETGRTHQIRVHMNHIGHTLVGDPVYGGRLMIPSGASENLKQVLRIFKRQALHAKKLGLIHPSRKIWTEWEAEIPEDMQYLIDVMEQDSHA